MLRQNLIRRVDLDATWVERQNLSECFSTAALLLSALRNTVRSRRDLVFEIGVLRQQLSVCQRQSKRPRLQRRDRMFWIWVPARPSMTACKPRHTTQVSRSQMSEAFLCWRGVKT